MIYILLIAILAVTTRKSQAQECENGWSKVGTKCMWKSSEYASRHENLQNCLKMNATLVSPETHEENELVKEFIGLNSENYYWLGGYLYVPDEASKFKFIWPGGKEINYADWNPGQPNHYTSSGGVCILLHGINGWDDYPCSKTWMQLCEKKLKYEDATKSCGCRDVLEKVKAMKEKSVKQAPELMKLTDENAKLENDLKSLQDQFEAVKHKLVIVSRRAK